MDIRSLRPANDFAIQYGFKSIIYGPPGSAKTPLLNTAPRPLLLATEPGLLSLRGSTIPTFCAFTSAAIDDFFKWFFNSNETKKFDTIGVDSISQLAEIYLTDAKKSNKHGMKAYGEMEERTYAQLKGLYFTQHKHTYLIAKEEIINDNGAQIRRPHFPGKALGIKVPHDYDAILRLAMHNVPGVGQKLAFRCVGSLEEMARNRTGTLSEFEPPNFSELVRKAIV